MPSVAMVHHELLAVKVSPGLKQNRYPEERMHIVPSAQGKVQEGVQEWVKPTGSSRVRFLWVPLLTMCCP